MDIEIRNYKQEDYPDIKAILEDVDFFDEFWDSEQNYFSMVKNSPHAIQVVLADKKVVGSIVLNSHGDEVTFFYRFAIKKEFRNKGIGSKLLEKVEKLAKERGAKSVAFYVNDSKEDLKEYYKRRGYQTSGKKYVCMWKLLNK